MIARCENGDVLLEALTLVLCDSRALPLQLQVRRAWLLANGYQSAHKMNLLNVRWRLSCVN